MKGLTLLFSTLIAFAVAWPTKHTNRKTNIGTYVPTHPEIDNSTYANVDYVQDTAVHIDWDNIFWGSQTINGSITHDMMIL